MNTESFMLRGQEINLGKKLNPEYLPDTRGIWLRPLDNAA